MFHDRAKIIQYTSCYLNARMLDLIDGTLGRQADGLLDALATKARSMATVMFKVVKISCRFESV